MVDKGGEELLDDLVAGFQQQAFAAFGQFAARHAGHGVGHAGALVFGAEVDLGGADGQAGGAALAFEHQGAAVGGVDIGEQDLAFVVGIDPGDVGP
ncbi:hypothetical protein D3C71_1574280 [compost metagenome]